jgi:hypothetical protein
MATKKFDPALLAKLTHGITGPASTDIERMIAHFDRLTAIRRKRPLTEAEQRVYDSLTHHVGEQFKSVINQMQRGMNMKSQINQGQRQVQKGGGTWVDGSVQSFWVVVQPIINFVKSIFTTPSNEPPITINDLLKMIGIDLNEPEKIGDEHADKIKTLTEKLKESIEKLRESVVSGIGGAANASMDMVLNAFSMMPGIGTTLLIWRMFQNVLVIIGSSLNVQAGATSAAASAAAAATGVAATTAAATATAAAAAATKKGGGIRNKNNHKYHNNRSITVGARALHQSLKRFSGMAVRISSAMAITNSKTKRVRLRNNIASLMSAYALKPATSATGATLLAVEPRSPHPILKPVAAA